MNDPSNGYDAVAAGFIARRAAFPIGADRVREWARSFAPGAAILDLGCGSGVPISQALVLAGLELWGVDASPTMIAAFRTRFPAAQAECSPVAESRFFDRTFEGAIAWGLLFLLEFEVQAKLIGKVARHLNIGGRFLFTSPWQVCEWADTRTGLLSRSLGAAEYRRVLEAAGLRLQEEFEDEGQNHYYSSERV